MKHLSASISLVFVILLLLAINSEKSGHAQISAEQTVEISQDQDSDNQADRGDRLRFNVNITNQGGSDALDVLFEELLDVNINLVPGSVQISPLAFPDSYFTLGNVEIIVDATKGLLVNDKDVDDTGVNPPFNDNLALIAVDTTSTLGGMVTIYDASGAFQYLPPTGVSNTIDTFQYVIQDGDGSTAVGQVTINIGGLLWFVDNTSVGGDGMLATPFATLAEAEAASSVGDIIFVFYGDGTSSGMNSGITLKDDQQLIGQGVDLIVNGTLLVPASTNPIIGNTGGDVITLANNNVVKGITIVSSASVGIAAANVSDATISDLKMNKSAGSSGGVLLSQIGGDFVFDEVGIFGNASGSAFTLNGGNANLTYFGTITNNAGRILELSNTIAGSIIFDGTANNAFNDTGAGILIDGLAGNVTIRNATLHGSDGLDLLGDTSNPLSGNVVLNNISIDVSGDALNIDGTTGGNNVTATIDLNQVEITNTSNSALIVQGLGNGASVDFDSASNFVASGNSTGIYINSNIGNNSITFNNLVTLGTGASALSGGTALDVSNNAAGTTLTIPNLAIQTSNQNAITVDGGGTLNLNQNGTGTLSINANTGNGLVLTNSTLNTVIDTFISTNGTNAFSVTGLSGGIDINNGSISGSSGIAFNVDGGNSTITYSGFITNSADQSIRVQNRTGGTVVFDTGTITDTGSGVLIQNNSGSQQITFSSPLVLNTGTNSAFALSNNSGATINVNAGLDIDTTTGTGLLATGGGTLNITGANNSINTQTGTTLNVDTLVMNTIFNSVVTTSSAANNGLSIANTSGNLTINGGSITRTQAGSRVVNFSGSNSGTYNLSTVSLNGNNSNGIVFSNGQNGTYTFGVLNVNNPNGGIGLNINNNSGNYTFRQINQSNGTQAIVISNTASGSFTITGDGTSNQNSSGGLLLDISGDLISLTNAANIVLNQIVAFNIGGQGIIGRQVNHFTIKNSTFNWIGNGIGEHCFNFLAGVGSNQAGITGTMLIDNVDVSNFTEYGLGVYNETGTANISVINGSNFTDNHDTFSKDAISVQTGGSANVTFTVNGSVFDNIEGDIVYYVAGSSGTNNINIINNRSTNGGGPDNFPNGGGIGLVTSNNATLTFDIQGNDIRDLRGDLLILSSAAGGGNMTGRVGGDLLNQGNTFSGSALDDGISIAFDGFNVSSNFNWTILVKNNSIGLDNITSTFNGIGDQGIQILHRDNAGTLNLTIENNTIANTGFEGIRLFTNNYLGIGQNNPRSNIKIANNTFQNISSVNGFQTLSFTSRDTAMACLHIMNNVYVSGSGTILLDQLIPSILSITQASTTALESANTNFTVQTGGTITFNGACTNPTLPSN